jgi:integrase
MSGFRSLWNRIAKLGELRADQTPHVLRHSFASLAAGLGYSGPTIAALIGDAVLLAAADTVAGETAVRMGDAKVQSDVVPLRRSGA